MGVARALTGHLVSNNNNLSHVRFSEKKTSGDKLMLSMKRCLELIFIFVALPSMMSCTVSGFKCGRNVGANYRQCDREGEVCVCATFSCAKQVPKEDCESELRYLGEDYADHALANTCVPADVEESVARELPQVCTRLGEREVLDDSATPQDSTSELEPISSTLIISASADPAESMTVDLEAAQEVRPAGASFESESSGLAGKFAETTSLTTEE